MAEYQGQGGSRGVHVPHLHTTATGEESCCGWRGSHCPLVFLGVPAHNPGSLRFGGWLQEPGAVSRSETEALPLFPQTTGGFLSCILGLVLPLAYGFQPDVVLMALGPAHGLQKAQAALLASVLRGPAGGRILAVVEEVNWATWI